MPPQRDLMEAFTYVIANTKRRLAPSRHGAFSPRKPRSSREQALPRRGSRNRCLRFLIILSLLISVTLLTQAQTSQQKMRGTFPFQSSEQLIYEAEFSRSLLRGISIAEFRLRVDERATQQTTPTTAANARPSTELVFTTEAVSKGFFQKLFGLNFRFAIESFVAPESFSVLRSLKHDEQGNRLRTSETVFDYDARRLIWTERDPKSPAKEPRIVESVFDERTGALQDLASVFYYLRTQPLTPGSSFELALSDSGRIYRVPVRVVRTKTIESPLGKRSALELDIALFGENRPVEGRGQMSLWFTDDARRIPLRARINSEMGTLTIKLKRYEAKAGVRSRKS